MKKKRAYTPRLPSIACPHCQGRAIVRTSEAITPLVRELRMVCDNPDCGCQFVTQLSVIRITRQSMAPNPEVRIPFGRWSPPANDDHRTPANDDMTTGLGAALDSVFMPT